MCFKYSLFFGWKSRTYSFRHIHVVRSTLRYLYLHLLVLRSHHLPIVWNELRNSIEMRFPIACMKETVVSRNTFLGNLSFKWILDLRWRLLSPALIVSINLIILTALLRQLPRALVIITSNHLWKAKYRFKIPLSLLCTWLVLLA